MHESTAFDYYVEEGLKRGVIQGQQRQLRSVGRKLLGEPDATTLAALEAIQDEDRLERLALSVLTATSWQELLATP